MQTLRVLLVFLAAAVLCSCTFSTPKPIKRDYSPQAARQQARQDFAAGQPRIYRAGGEASFEPGIGNGQRKLVATLPRDGSLVGCTNPHAQFSVSFATAYNQEIIQLLRGNQ